LGAREIKATCLITLTDTQRYEVDVGKIFVVQSEEFPSGPAIQILVDRHGGFPEQSESAGAGRFQGGVTACIQAECSNRNNHEATECQQGNRR
jgi:hypothetical protein